MTCVSCSPSRLNVASIFGKLRATAELMVGQGDYDAYVAHAAAAHPELAPLSREEYFRERQARRYGEGGAVRVFRCC